MSAAKANAALAGNENGAQELTSNSSGIVTDYGTLPTAAALVMAPMTNAIGVLPVVSSVANAVWKADPNELSPAFDALKLLANFRNDVNAHKTATQMGWDAARLAGYVFGIPLANVAKPLLIGSRAPTAKRARSNKTERLSASRFHWNQI